MGSQRNGFNKESFILSVDVGTTSIRCHVYDKKTKIRGSCNTKVFIFFHLSFLVARIRHTFYLRFLIWIKLFPGCSFVSRGWTCGDGSRGTLERLHHCGQRSCARYSCTSSCCPIAHNHSKASCTKWFSCHVNGNTLWQMHQMKS